MADISITPSGADTFTINIDIKQGDCLWDVAEQVSEDLQAKGMKVDKDVIFQDLSHDPHFAHGSDDGVLPTQYQGDKNQPLGTRDLDLIYAGDKFKIDLTKPSTEVNGKTTSEPAKTTVPAWNPFDPNPGATTSGSPWRNPFDPNPGATSSTSDWKNPFAPNHG